MSRSIVAITHTYTNAITMVKSQVVIAVIVSSRWKATEFKHRKRWHRRHPLIMLGGFRDSAQCKPVKSRRQWLFCRHIYPTEAFQPGSESSLSRELEPPERASPTPAALQAEFMPQSESKEEARATHPVPTMRASAKAAPPVSSHLEGGRSSGTGSYEPRQASAQGRQLPGMCGEPAGVVEVESLDGRALREERGSERKLRGSGATGARGLEVGVLERPALGRGGGVGRQAPGAYLTPKVVLDGDEHAGVLTARQDLDVEVWSGGTSGLARAGSVEAREDGKGTPASSPNTHPGESLSC